MSIDVGRYYRREYIEREYPEVLKEWDDWLNTNCDPGNYDSYKIKDQSILPYIDGKPQWVTDVYMPPHIVCKLGVKV